MVFLLLEAFPSSLLPLAVVAVALFADEFVAPVASDVGLAAVVPAVFVVSALVVVAGLLLLVGFAAVGFVVAAAVAIAVVTNVAAIDDDEFVDFGLFEVLRD